MKKILVLGKNGMAGHMMFNHLSESNKYNVVGWSRLDADFMEITEEALKKKLKELKPDILINCAGIIPQNKFIQDGSMKKVNEELPHLLAKLGDDLKYKLIHISTDCVFGNDEYAKTKLAGEVRKDNHLTIRTSIIGPETNKQGAGLFNWYMQRSGYVNGFTKHIWNGVTTLQLSSFIDQLISSDFDGLTKVKLLDYRSSMSIDKYKLLSTIAQKIGKYNTIIQPFNTEVVDRTIPKSGSYDKQIFELTNYVKQIQDLRAWILSHKGLYDGIYNIE